MPDLDLTRSFWVGKNQNRNQPVLMVGSSGLGPSVLGKLSVGFRFWSRCQYFAKSIKIWSIFGRIWTRSRWYLVGSGGFHVDFKKLFVEKLLDLAGFCWFYGWVEWLGFLGRKPASQPEGIGSCGWRPVGDCRIDRFRWWSIGFGRVRRVERVTELCGHP